MPQCILQVKKNVIMILSVDIKAESKMQSFPQCNVWQSTAHSVERHSPEGVMALRAAEHFYFSLQEKDQPQTLVAESHTALIQHRANCAWNWFRKHELERSHLPSVFCWVCKKNQKKKTHWVFNYTVSMCQCCKKGKSAASGSCSQ